MTDYDGKVDFAKVDIDDLQDLAMNYNVYNNKTDHKYLQLEITIFNLSLFL